MSGGSLSYFYSDLESHVGDFDDFELDELVKDLVELFHDREWYLSMDYGERDWDLARSKFKKKWFGGAEARAERIDQYLKDLKKEIFASLAIEEAK